MTGQTLYGSAFWLSSKASQTLTIQYQTRRFRVDFKKLSMHSRKQKNDSIERSYKIHEAPHAIVE